MVLMKKRWLILFSLVAIISVLGLCVTGCEGNFSLPTNLKAQDYANIAWMITATIFVLMMTPGLAFFYGGMVRVKNVISTMLQSFIVMGVVSVIWVVFGFGLAFGDDLGGIIGNPAHFFMLNHVGVENMMAASPSSLSQIDLSVVSIPLALFALFQMKFAIITPSLITGSFAERVKFSGYLIFMCLWVIFVYCPLAHMTWHPEGLFVRMHVHDFAGGIVVHAASGVAALAGALFLGKRTNEEGKAANIPFVLLGAAMLWLGWFGFNGGSSLAADGIAISAFLNTNTAAATAMVTWVFLDCILGRRPSAMGAAIGAVVGLVAITPSAGWVTVGQSVFIAFVTTIICNTAVTYKAKKHLFDDALDVFPTHGLGGIIGTLLTGVFTYSFFYPDPAKAEVGRWAFFGYHALAIAIVFIYTFAMSYGLYWITNKMVRMRVSAKSERIGLDRSQHNEEYGFDHTELAEDCPTESEWFKGIEES